MQTAAAMLHYETHLAPIYSWMLGDIEAAFARSAAELEELRLPPAAAAVAVDLGAGLGLHALALAQSRLQCHGNRQQRIVARRIALALRSTADRRTHTRIFWIFTTS